MKFSSPIRLALWWLLLVVSSQDTLLLAAPFDNELKQKQVDWLRSSRCDGYFNDKIGFAPPGQDDSPIGGLYALQDISKDEELIHVPHHCLFKPPEQSEDQSPCATAAWLLEHYLVLGEDESDFWPYVQYVFESFPHETVPWAWSEEGKALVQNIVGTHLLEPSSFGSFDPCPIVDDSSSPDEQHNHHAHDPNYRQWLDMAYRIVYSRGWEETLVPVYDMGNHHNGHFHNMDQVHDSATHDDFHVVALRDIQAGEPLCLSYNECNDYTCYGKKYSYITPILFNDYGFVERYPQRWALETGDGEGDELLFEVQPVDDDNDSENNNTNSTDIKLSVEWISALPREDQLEWLDVNLKRLQGMKEFVAYEAQFLESEHEARSSVEFHAALTLAMEHALLWSKGSDPRQVIETTKEECEANATQTSATTTTESAAAASSATEGASLYGEASTEA